MTSKELAEGTRSSRRFRAYCVGIAKTGTNSMADLFGRYRSGHEFMFQETVAQIAAWQEGMISPESFKAYILYRDRQGDLEMDSATFNHNYLHILIQEFSEAKFIFTVRDCYSWLNSLLNMSWRSGNSIPDWMFKYGKFFIGYEVNRSAVSSVEAMLEELPNALEGLLSYWQKSNQRILDLLPPERSLIVPTHKLSQSLEQIANLVGVTPESLVEEAKHSNQAPPGYDWLKYIDQDLLEERCSFYCGSLMERLFPDLMEVGRK
ncbi:sulfotransferase [Microseira wollei]|uniref:Sulfotransferase n=1 Tax=Microseira wollei NIES-4236 TaxID=2530354 RepID=A0AAV3WEA5_9CYAN|nr:sulfotransferase [Microseira wollei]GET35394.1 hypothetical protein MiSe_01360 [Microseira wollei NIES-4236]